jgi:hypothetical protein
LLFYHERVRRPFFNFAQEAAQRGIGKHREPLGEPTLLLPHSRSNVWPRSWKRFLIDFMYGRGYVMLYPNLHEQHSFSTTYMERGGHTAKDGLKETVEAHTTRKDIDPLKTVRPCQPACATGFARGLSPRGWRIAVRALRRCHCSRVSLS